MGCAGAGDKRTGALEREGTGRSRRSWESLVSLQRRVPELSTTQCVCAYNRNVGERYPTILGCSAVSHAIVRVLVLKKLGSEKSLELLHAPKPDSKRALSHTSITTSACQEECACVCTWGVGFTMRGPPLSMSTRFYLPLLDGKRFSKGGQRHRAFPSDSHSLRTRESSFPLLPLQSVSLIQQQETLEMCLQ